MIELSKEFLKLPEQLYGKIKRVGVLNNEPILYGDVNLLRLGDLYYIIPAKLVYRYIKTDVKRVSLVVLAPTTVTYMFENIKITSTEKLIIPEEEKGTIRRAGRLFDKIIYSGDPNIVDSGNLYYHLTLPLVSEVKGVNEDGDIEISTFDISEGEVIERTTEYKTKPEREVDYVDLGLPSGTLWAKRNLGAESETDIGLYYAWAETQGYTADLVGVDKLFEKTDYKYVKGKNWTKYNNNDKLTKLELEDDAAYVNTEGLYEIPTDAQVWELIQNTNRSPTIINNVEGLLLTSLSDSTKYIFLPKTSTAEDGKIITSKSSYIWTSNLASNITTAIPLEFNTENGLANLNNPLLRYIGLSIRPVVYVAP